MAKHVASHTEAHDDDAKLAELEGQLQALQNAPKGDHEGGEAKAIDPATITMIITAVLELIKLWRARK